VIKVLLEEGIPLDLVAGSSMGAVVAAAFAEGRPAKRLVEDMKHHWDSLGNFLLDVRDYNFPRTNLLRGRKIRRMIEVAMKESRIEETQVPIYVVCTDLITGQEVVLSEGPLGEAIRTSGSLPGIFKPTWWDGHLLVDGAVLNKVPAKVLKEKGARYVIAVNVTPERETKFVSKGIDEVGFFSRCLCRIPAFKEWLQYPNIFRIIMRSLSVSGLHQSRAQKDLIDVEIKPRIEDFDFLRFDQFDQLVAAGEEATRKALPEIRKSLQMNQ
ncbi:MAG: patatin-like phospholipase family protein, partial [Candidatus Omnitrophica bacterium]|nr:patatin-like phospholipase family protein [Candidatus Omnitrophota bacterium]